jgi:hypothetical protein
MFRVEVDIFSGRPNPAWIVTNENLAQKVLKAVEGERGLAAKPGSGFQGLGFRGMIVKTLGDNDDVRAAKIPKTFVLGTGTGSTLQRGADVITTVVKEMIKSAQIVLPEHQLTPIDREMQELILSELTRALENPLKERRAEKVRAVMRRKTIPDGTCTQCQYEISLFNPAFWNSDPFVQRNNNCYNYARDWRTDTFAQPGRASGHPNSVMQCAQVSAAARFDGLVDRCRCLPASEYPRRLMALVIYPNGDYHWYRQQQGGFWGHKPGQTPAKNTDNSGVVITNPETCNRGPYTNFCGYFYAGKSVIIA